MDRRTLETLHDLAVDEWLTGNLERASRLYMLLYYNSDGDEAGNFLATRGLIQAFMGNDIEGRGNLRQSKMSFRRPEDRAEMENLAGKVYDVARKCKPDEYKRNTDQ